jgi:hypothetical protein
MTVKTAFDGFEGAPATAWLVLFPPDRKARPSGR